MKLETIWKISSSLIFIAAITVLINSCKKETKSNNNEYSNGEDEKINIRNLISKNGIPFTIPINKKIQTFYSDTNGNELTKESISHLNKGDGKTENSFVSQCTGDIWSDTLKSYTLTSNCHLSPNGFKISWTYNISYDNNLVLSNGSYLAKGYIKIQNGSTVVYSNTSVSNVTINDLGPDANVPGNELFSVTYATGWLPDSYFNLAWAVQLGGRVPSDCPDIEPFVQGLTPYTPTSFEYPLTTPCNRIDTIWGATSSNPFRFYGEDPTGTCTNSGFVYPSLQQIEYNINGVWYGESQTMDSLIRDTAMSYYLPPTGGPFSNFLTSKFGLVDPYGSLELQIDITKRTSGHGKMYIRTRNIVYNKPLSQYGGQWPIPKFVGTNQNCCVSPWSSLYTYSY